MNLYLISQAENNNYDTYSAAVVAAPGEDAARLMSPSNGDPITDWREAHSYWCSCPAQVKVFLIGVASPGTNQDVVLASYNA